MRRSGLGVRPALVTLAFVTLLVAAIATARTDRPPGAGSPPWLPARLGSLTVQPGVAEKMPIEAGGAIGSVRHSVFLGRGPASKPLVFPVLVTGRIARAPIPPSPSGELGIPKSEDLPAWLVVWRGLDGDALDARLGSWPPGTLVDAVFLVDGGTGDCCWFSGFLQGVSRLR